MADNFYTNGPSKLQKFLPFRLATWINRFLVAAVAIGSAAVTIFKLLPAPSACRCTSSTPSGSNYVSSNTICATD